MVIFRRKEKSVTGTPERIRAAEGCVAGRDSRP